MVGTVDLLWKCILGGQVGREGGGYLAVQLVGLAYH